MEKVLLFISIVTCFFFLSPNAFAQNNQIVTNGTATNTVTFPGSGCIYNWVNDNPGIGLAA
ncbi:MAG: hypothetical protein JWR67_1061, partial [Mucilaginibacter sp.]|nr:hypothetical protein [Mucilaginibacter sp.]